MKAIAWAIIFSGCAIAQAIRPASTIQSFNLSDWITTVALIFIGFKFGSALEDK